MENKKLSQITSLQASAGSGKTYNLAKRYIRILLDYDKTKKNIPLKNVIAVTFANKAAVEMKYRVIEYLKKAALSLETDGIFDGIKDASLKSVQILDEILNNYDGFNISTIDSFINSVLKACAVNTGLSPNFKIEKDYSENLNFAVDSFLENSTYSLADKNILLKYISQYLLSEKTGWFPRNDIYNEIEKVFKKVGNSGKNIALACCDFDEELKNRSQDIVKAAANFLNKYSGDGIYERCLKAVRALSEEKIFPNFRKIPTAFISPLKYKQRNIPDENAVNAWDDIRQKISDFCLFYGENYYGIYCDIFSKISREFDAKAKKDELVFLQDMNKKALSVFEGNDVALPEIYYRLSEKYRHFLIDEFQDTSPVQWAGIKRFLEESLAGGGTFFYVGDVKQAIYDFRGGNKAIFDNALTEFSQIEDKDISVLGYNYRSAKTIVELNNKIFSSRNIERYLNDLFEGKEVPEEYGNMILAYSNSKQEVATNKEGGYVEIKVFDKKADDADEEIRKFLADTVKSVCERCSPEDITVLCRSNAEVSKAGAWLLEEGYEVESNQTLNIKNNDIIKQIVSLMMFVDSPADALSFSSFLTGEIFTKAASLKEDEMRDFIFDSRAEEEEFLYKKFEKAFPELWKRYFEDFFVGAGVFPVYELVLSVLEKFNITENFDNSRLFIMRFLELVNEFEKENSGLENFLEYFKELDEKHEEIYVKSTSGNGIKIMTVHKAKGLQFPVVIIPFLKLSHSKTETPFFKESGNEIKLLYLQKSFSDFSEELKNFYDKKRAESLMSEMNVLYVSMTRAEYELYAFIPQKDGSAKNTALLLIGKENTSFGIKNKYTVKKEIRDTISDISKSGYKNISGYIKRKKEPDINEAMRRGTILHFALSRIKSLKDKEPTFEIEKACAAAKRKFLCDNIEWLKEKLLKLFENKAVISFFEYDEKDILNEPEITNSNGISFRPDKIVKMPDGIAVIDFKSSNIKEEENRVQVEGYKKLVNEIFDSAADVFGYIVDADNAEIIKV